MVLWFIYHMMKYPAANALVIRKVGLTLRESCFAALEWAINRYGFQDYWKISRHSLRMEIKATGQKIIFAGLDVPQKLMSITVARGVLCWVWIEELFQAQNGEDFDFIDESIRGALPEGGGLWKQITCTFNPWRPFQAQNGSSTRSIPPFLPTILIWRRTSSR